MRIVTLVMLALLLGLPASAQSFPTRDRDFNRQVLGTLLGIVIEHARQRQPEYRAPRQPVYRPRPQPQPQPYPDQAGRPGGYDTISVNGLPVRLDPTALPIRIHSNDPRYHTAFTQGITLWNHTGLGTFFTVSDLHSADLVVDWSGRGISSGARAETRMETGNGRVIPRSIVVRPDNLSTGDLSQVMTHELGHVLGLDHSQVRSDVMYRSEQRSGRAELTSRDLQMLRWLYSQTRYVPAVGSRHQTVTASLGRGWTACH